MNLELNKVAAAVLFAGLIAMGAGKASDILYTPEHSDKRGFSVEVAAEEVLGTGTAEAADAAPVDIATLLAKADAAAGQALSKKCAACHDFTKGGPNKVGPNLHGIVGKKAGGAAGFAYSDAMKAHGAWTEQALSDFLTKPSKAVPGTKMAFAGISKAEERANLIAYLKTLK